MFLSLMKNFSQKNFTTLILKVVAPKTYSSPFMISKSSEFIARSVLCITRVSTLRAKWVTMRLVKVTMKNTNTVSLETTKM